MLKKILFDCDNTFGLPGCDVDDGLALLYLLGCGKADLVGITTTYGNSTLEAVDSNTRRMLKTIGREDIPVARGSAAAGGTDGQAARFLCEMADRYAGTLYILATGSMTNLFAAHRLDPAFFSKVSQVAIMGGITAPLCIGGKVLDELNLSCDPAASLCVLEHAPNLKIATGNRCMDAFFSRKQCDARLGAAKTPFAAWLHRSMAYWFDREREVFGHDGSYQWDVYAAACLVEPELFDAGETRISPSLASLRSGMLTGGGAERTVFLPRVRDAAAFAEHLYDVYLNNHFIPKDEVRHEN